MANVDALGVIPRIIKLRDRVRSYGRLIANGCGHTLQTAAALVRA